MVVAADGGKLDQALAEVEKQYALGQKSNDIPAMAGDLQFKGNILLEMGRYDDAKKAHEEAVRITTESSLSQEVKDNTVLFHHYNLTRVAIGKKDFATAKTETEAFKRGAEAAKNENQIKQAHELIHNGAGREELRSGNHRVAPVKSAKPEQSLSSGRGISGKGRRREGEGVVYEGGEVQFVAATELCFCSC